MTATGYRTLNRARRVAQVAMLAVLVAIPLLSAAGIHWLIGTLYALSIGPLDIADPAMALQTLLLTRSVYLPLLLAAALPVALALVLGRVFCSWLCPYNTLAEWADGLQRRFFRKRWARLRRRAPAANPRPAVYWGIFGGLLVLTLLAGLPLLAFLSAPGILSSQLSQAMLGAGVGLELALVGGVLAAEIAVARRFWCKYACPVGATLALCHTRWTLRIRREPAACACRVGGEACRAVCPLGLAPTAGEVHPYCFNCGACLAACEKVRNHALTFAFAGVGPVRPPGGNGRPRPVAAGSHTAPGREEATRP
jgi:ferredoxin-type protein NapH